MDFGAEFGSNNCSIRTYVAIVWHELSPKAVIAAPLGDFGQSLAHQHPECEPRRKLRENIRQ